MSNPVLLAVLSGTLVFVFGQVLQKFVLEPIYEYKKIVRKIDNKLKYYANILTNSGFNKELIVKVTDTVRALSCDLESSYKQIPFNNFFSTIETIETKNNIAEVATKLISISNSGGRSGERTIRCNDEIEKVRKMLKIESLN
ncbi:hypothetical protein KKD03_01635 [Patescibacteria group bacterium]|nr:hypothetical protein [Patescibacteria group bacterium]